jgi:phospholipid/cholesterol/gamma-HCH transport system ATP-binding protein
LADALAVRELTGPVGAPLVHDVSLAVPFGTTHVLLGPIHSGKTMVLRHLVGLEVAERGTIAVDGESYDLRGEPEIVTRRMRTRIGVVFEGSALISRIGIVENVELPLLEHTDATPGEARDAARELLAEVGMGVDEDVVPERLSRGARRRVALARALALRPAALLLDEPTLGLDAHAAAELDDTIARVQDARGFGVLIFSHEVRHAFGRAQEISVMAEGRIIAQGARDALEASAHPVVQRLLHRRGRR